MGSETAEKKEKISKIKFRQLKIGSEIAENEKFRQKIKLTILLIIMQLRKN